MVVSRAAVARPRMASIGARMHLLLLIFIFLLNWKSSECAGQLRISEDGGYNNLVVAIHPSVPQDDLLLTSVQRLLTDASKYLYQSTRQMSYFNSVTVVIPDTWETNPSWQTAGQESFDNAEVQVTPPNCNYGDSPRVVRQGIDCGMQAGSVVLTPNLLLEALNYNQTNGDGDPARWFINLWAQFRYGVFDEHGYASSTNYPFFYYSEEHHMAMPTSCATASLLFGDIIDVTTGQHCTDFNGEFPASPNCEYILHPTLDETSTSITYGHQYGTVTQFCDDTEENLHNKEAPTKQNVYCNGRSTWDVISNSADFRDKPVPPAVADTTPIFQVTYEAPRRYVIVYDASSSTNGTIAEIYQRAVTKWVWYDVSPKILLGAVAFSDNAWILSNITKMDTVQNRMDYISTIPEEGYGATCIGCGLLEGLQVLRNDGSTEGGVLIVVSDGLENGDPTIHTVANLVEAAGVTVHWMAFGDTMGSPLSLLVESTRGRTFHIYDSVQIQGGSAMASALFEIVSAKERSKVLDLIMETPEDTIVGHVIMDDAIGVATAVTVMYDHESIVPHLVVFSPNGSMHSSNANHIANGIVALEIPFAEPGNWEYLITGLNVNSSVAVAVTSGIRNHEKAIAVEGWTNYFIAGKLRPIAIFAEVKSGSLPVINATTIAQIQRPNGEFVSVALLDNGADPDFEKDDGVYSRYFTEVDQIGRYSVAVVARDDRHDFYSAAALQGSSEPYTLEPFQRAVTVGFFSALSVIFGREMDNETQPIDILPPSRIFDLTVISKNSITRQVTIRWTSPGDDYDHGSAHRTELFIVPGGQGKTIVRNITGYPEEAGTVQTAVISLADFDTSPQIYSTVSWTLTLRAVDETGNVSEESNAVQVIFHPPEGDAVASGLR